MSWTPKYETRGIATVRKNAQAIAERDHTAVCAYYNAQADASGIVLQPFQQIVNTRYFDLFISERIEQYPVLIIAASEDSGEEKENYIDGKYLLTVEVWGVGSDPFKLRAKLERYGAAVKQMFLKADPRDFTTGITVANHTLPIVSAGKVSYRVIKAAAPNDYQDTISMSLAVGFMEK